MITDLLLKYTSQEELLDFASKQGVAGIVYEDYSKAHAEGRKILERKEFLRLSMFIDYCHKSYASQEKKIAQLAHFYSKHGIRMMVLKGYGISLDWPKPDARPCGDLDIFLFRFSDDNGIVVYDGVWKQGDEALSNELGVKIDVGHEHHTNFTIDELSVENHYDFINVKGHKDAPAIEAQLKKYAAKGVREVDVHGAKVYLPSANFNVLFLLRHMGQHFAGSEMYLRQMLDWGYFMKAHSAEVDWDELLPIIEDMGMMEFFHQSNGICVDYLGFDEQSFPPIERKAELEKRILDDVLNPEFGEELPTGNVIKVIWFKNRRYWANAWKRKLIFKDSPVVDFFYGCIAHLRKWETIKEG